MSRPAAVGAAAQINMPVSFCEHEHRTSDIMLLIERSKKWRRFCSSGCTSNIYLSVAKKKVRCACRPALKTRSSTQKGQLRINTETDSIDGDASGIRGEPMKISKQPCRRRDGGMEVDGDMEVASINIKTLSIKI